MVLPLTHAHKPGHRRRRAWPSRSNRLLGAVLAFAAVQVSAAVGGQKHQSSAMPRREAPARHCCQPPPSRRSSSVVADPRSRPSLAASVCLRRPWPCSGTTAASPPAGQVPLPLHRAPCASAACCRRAVAGCFPCSPCPLVLKTPSPPPACCCPAGQGVRQRSAAAAAGGAAAAAATQVCVEAGAGEAAAGERGGVLSAGHLASEACAQAASLASPGAAAHSHAPVHPACMCRTARRQL